MQVRDAAIQIEPFTNQVLEIMMGRSILMANHWSLKKAKARLEQVRIALLKQGVDMNQVSDELRLIQEPRGELLAEYAIEQASKRPVISRMTRNVLAMAISFGAYYWAESTYSSAGDALGMAAAIGIGFLAQLGVTVFLAEFFPTPGIRLGRYGHQLQLPGFSFGKTGSATDRDYALGYRLAKLRSRIFKPK